MRFKDLVESVQDDEAMAIRVLELLGVDLDDEHRQSAIRDIKRKIKDGWLQQEILAYMRNMEEVNPDISEERALANMRRIKAAVMARLGK